MINTLKNENDLLKERLKCIKEEVTSFQSDICIESSEISILMKTFFNSCNRLTGIKRVLNKEIAQLKLANLYYFDMCIIIIQLLYQHI
jgi:hypothetical protein